MDIPEKLKRDDLRFILVSEKSPVEKEWTTKNNYKFDEEKIKKYEKNLGIVCGYGNLAILDCDSLEMKDVADKELPETFEVKTGSGGCHKYYFIDDLDKKIIFQVGEKHFGELQWNSTQCVIAGSTHPNGNKYIVVKDIEIKKISKADIISKLFKFMNPKDLQKQYNKKNVNYDKHSNLVEEIKAKIKITDLMSDYGYDLSKHPTVCKLGHSTKGKGNFSYNDDLFNCFHCNKSGDIFSFIMEHENCDFKTALKILREKAGIELTTEIKREDINELRKEVYHLLFELETPDGALATEIMSNFFMQQNKTYALRQDDKQEIWIYNNGIYEPNGVSYIEEFVYTILGKYFKNSFAKQCIDKIRVKNYISADEFFNKEYRDLICIDNGILNIKTRILTPYDQNLIFFQKIPVKFDPTKKPIASILFMEDILENKEDVELLQQLFGYCLYRSYPIEKAFMLLGKGRNGKSQLTLLLETFLGNKNTKHFSLQSLCKEGFNLSELQGKLANISGEINQEDLNDTDNFKKLVGQDTLSADRKFKTSISFTNYSKLIFNCNQLPKTNDNSNGFWDRWILLNFPYRFEYKEIIDKIPDTDSEKKYLKVRKNDIINSLTTENELSGILNWALDGLEDLLKKGHFTFTKSALDVKRRWSRLQNSFQSFLDEFIVYEYDIEITKSDLKRYYALYCMRHKVTPVSDFVIKETFSNNYGVIDTRSSNEGRPYVWKNVSFKMSMFEIFTTK